MYAEVPLALSTTFSLIGAGSFVTLSVVVGVSRLEQKRLTNLDTLSLMLTLAVVLGFVAAFFAFQDQTNAVSLFRGLNDVAWFVIVGVAGLFVAVAVLYGIRVNFGNIATDERTFLLCLAGASGVIFVGTIGMVPLLISSPSLSTVAMFVEMLGFALLGGSALVSLMFEKVEALDSALTKMTLTLIAFFGVVMGCIGFAVQVGVALGAGSDVVREASSQIVVAFFCLVASFVFEIMAIRIKETGFHSVVAVASAFVGVFSACLVLYASLVTLLA
ncbi:MAG: hypothetical protein VB027_10735 [Gordonibacter sp.]|nr:hypothetical protein [Gordonibacter sp.]